MTGTEQSIRPAELEDSARYALDCYLSSLLVFAECVEAACPPIGAQYYDQVVRIRRRLAFDNSRSTLEETRGALESTLMAYAEQAQRYCDMRSEEREGLLEIVDKIEQTVTEPTSIAPLLEEIRTRLNKQQETAVVDPLTGLVNRRELERQIKLRLASGKQFCMLFFDIDDFGVFNETLGRESGDQVLRQVAERINTQIRARDLACRWLADEFIVLLECDMENARRRSTQMAQWLRGPYTIEEEGRPAKLEIRVSAAATECGPGDTPRQIWLRLEEDFHQQNNTAVVA